MQYDGIHKPTTYAATLIKALRRYPDRIAAIDGEIQISYRHLSARISKLVKLFEAQGLQPGDGLAQLSQNSLSALCVQLAAYLLGLRYTPLHPMGSIDDHAHIIEDSQSRAFVFDPRGFEEHAGLLVGRTASKLIVLAHAKSERAKDLFAEADKFAAGPLETRSNPEDIVALLYTGGTSGRPKGVALSSHAMVLNVLLCLSEWEWPAQVRFLCSTPITHATGCMLIPIFLRGGTVILQPGFKPAEFLKAVQRHKVTTTFLVPTMIYLLLEEQRKSAMDVSSLETVIYGGAPIAPARLAEAIAAFGKIFMQIYSQSEAPNCATVLRRAEHDAGSSNRLSSCGRPMAGIDVRIIGESGEFVAQGEVGEICFRGPSIMRSYWHRPEESSEVFENDWLHTGDLGFQDDQDFIYIVDRRKEMIVTGGFNVYPREIEDVITAHPAVSAAVVVGVPDEKWGEAVKAVVVAKEGSTVSGEDIIKHVKAKKGSVAAPKSVDFVDRIPLTALGKPDKKVVRAQFWNNQTRQVH